MVKRQTNYISKGCVLVETPARMVVNTSLPHANLMHDASRPFAVCVKLGNNGRVSCLGRYETEAKARAALRYLK